MKRRVLLYFSASPNVPVNSFSSPPPTNICLCIAFTFICIHFLIISEIRDNYLLLIFIPPAPKFLNLSSLRQFFVRQDIEVSRWFFGVRFKCVNLILYAQYLTLYGRIWIWSIAGFTVVNCFKATCCWYIYQCTYRHRASNCSCRIFKNCGIVAKSSLIGYLKA